MNVPVDGVDLAAVEYDPFADDGALARVVPTTEPQREVWLASQLSLEASLAYNESISLRLRGTLDRAALAEAVQGLVARHESLRATLSADGQELRIAEHLAIDVALLRLDERAPAEREAAIAEALKQAVETPFDLELGPLLRAQLLVLGEREHLLVFTAHHIVCDGWSFGVIAPDLAQLYRARLGLGADVAAADSFADYALAQSQWSTTPEHADDEAFWLGRFAASIPVLDLPTDRPRQATRSFASRRADRLIDATLIAELRRLGARQGASLFSALLAGFNATLARIAGSDDLVIGVPFAGQSVGGHRHLVGHCVNLLPLRLVYDPQATLGASMSAVQTVMLDAFEHPQYTFGTLLKKLSLARDPSRLPLVSVMFNLDQTLDANALGFPELDVEFAGNPRSFENFELFVNAVQLPQGLRLECQYNADLFDETTVQRWLAGYETLLRDACTQSETAQGRLAIVTADDLAKLNAWNDTRREFRRGALVHRLVEEQAQRAPERVAVRTLAETCRYGELETRANRIAQRLRALGVGRGALVGLQLDRNADMLAAMLGVLKAGAAYVPLDPGYPKERLAYMAEDAALAALVTLERHAALLGWPRERTLLLDADAALLAAAPATALAASPLDAQAEDPAYVIYTSGSTGKPKGVQVPHRSVVNYLESMAREPGLGADDRLLAVTTLSFDIAVTELLLPLTVGAEIVLATRDEALDGEHLRRTLAERAVTVLQATPATWRLLLESGWSGTPTLRALCGGEALPADLSRQLLGRVGELWNMYGPTETTVWSTCCRITSPDEPVTIGRPIGNNTVWVLDALGQTCPIGVPGELFIGGDGVTLGYLNRPELSAERFVADRFGWAPGARLYRTGDRGRWLASGRIEHLGRTDFQVKVRGFRIELGEIEAALLAHAEIARAVVVTREDRPGDVRLVAYLVARSAAAPTDAALTTHLRATLPDYMIPQHLVSLAEIPLLPNGKVNRHALPAPQAGGAASSERADFVAPSTELEHQVVQIMQAALSLDGIGLHDDFFRLGGHSLLAARLIARLNRELGVSLPMRSAFECPSAAQLVAAITAARSGGPAATRAYAPIERQAEQSSGPLTLGQARIRFVEEMHPGRVTYNTPSAHRLRGKFDAPAFERAFAEVVARQPALRTVIAAEGGGHVQRVLERVECPLLPIEDLSAVAPAEREAELMRRLEALIDLPFDLARGPLFAARLFKLAEEEHAFFFMTHHVIWDGWSFDLLYEEMAAAYGAALAGQRSALALPPVSFIDYAHWHNAWLASDACREQIAYWQAQFADAEPAIDIPTDMPRKPGMSGRGATEWVRIDRGLTDRLHGIARQADSTLNMVALAAYAAMLHATAQSRELTLGIPVRGRPLPELDPVMGFFNNLLPLRVRVDPATRFVDWVRELKRLMLGAFDHQDVPFERLVQEVDALKDTRSAGAYQALFSFQDARERTRTWGGLKQEGILVFQRGATEDLGLWLMEGPSGLEGGVTYNAELFLPETAALLRRRFVELLERACARPDASIGELLDIGRAEQQALARPAAGASAAAWPLDLGGASPALRFGDRHWTRADLGRRIEAIRSVLAAAAADLRRVGVDLADPMDRLAAWLAVWQGGGSCVMSPSGSASALAGRVDLVIGDADARGRWPADMRIVELGANAAAAPGAAPPATTAAAAIELVGSGASSVVSMSTLAALAQAEAAALAAPAGSTWLVGANLPEPCLALHALAALAANAELVWLPNSVARDGDQLAAMLKAASPAVAHLAPGSWRALLDAWWTTRAPLAALVDGDELHPELAAALAQAGATVWTLHRPAGLELPMTLGRHAGGSVVDMGEALLPGSLLVADAHGRALPVGVSGRLLARLDGSTAAVGSGLARWRSDGRLIVSNDDPRRVALGGQRIDLPALEAVGRDVPAVAECVAAIQEPRPGDRRLDLYAVPVDGRSIDEGVLRAALDAALPRGARVDSLTVLTSVPRLADGHPDRAALLARLAGGAAERPLPSTPTELALAEVWSSLLGAPQVELSDNFFDLGGSSLLAMQAVELVAQRIGKRITPRRYVFETLGQLALAYDSEDLAAPAAAAPVEAPKSGLFKKLGGLLRRGG